MRKALLIPSSLLRGNINVQALELERPNLELIRNKKGIWNVSTLGSTAPATKLRQIRAKAADCPWID